MIFYVSLEKREESQRQGHCFPSSCPRTLLTSSVPSNRGCGQLKKKKVLIGPRLESAGSKPAERKSVATSRRRASQIHTWRNFHRLGDLWTDQLRETFHSTTDSVKPLKTRGEARKCEQWKTELKSPPFSAVGDSLLKFPKPQHTTARR